MSSDDSNAAAIIDFAKHYERAEGHEVIFEGVTEQVLVTEDSEGGTCITTVRDLFSDRAERPIRRKGTIEVHDLDSFVRATNAGSDGNSAIFADAKGRKVTAILDFHEKADAGKRGAPRWGQDRIEYGFTLSPQLRAWLDASMNRDGSPKMLDQKTFAALIDNRLGDVADDPPVKGSVAAEFARRRGISLATIAELLVFTRTIAAKASTVSEEIHDDNTGDVSIQFTKKSDIKARDGSPVAVPQAFALKIPILCGIGATEFTIAVRLRYDVPEGGKIAWRIEINALDQYILAAIDEALDVVRGPREKPAVAPLDATTAHTLAEPFVPGCGLPVYMGVAPPL